MNTDNVRPQWLNFMRRLQQAACTQKGYAVVSIRVLVDPAGNPAFWWEPVVSRLEPAVSAALFLDKLLAEVKAEDSG